MKPSDWLPVLGIAGVWLAWYLKDRSDRARDRRERLIALYAEFIGLATLSVLFRAADANLDPAQAFKLVRLRSELYIVENNARLRQLVERVMNTALGADEKTSWKALDELEEAVRGSLARL